MVDYLIEDLRFLGCLPRGVVLGPEAHFVWRYVKLVSGVVVFCFFEESNNLLHLQFPWLFCSAGFILLTACMSHSQIYDYVMMFHGIQKTEVDARWKSFHVVKGALQNQVKWKLLSKVLSPAFINLICLSVEHSFSCRKLLFYLFYFTVVVQRHAYLHLICCTCICWL